MYSRPNRVEFVIPSKYRSSDLDFAFQKNSWSTLYVPHGPPPRSGHASVVTPQSGGSIYIHGGEFSSKNGESFYHYKDFWCLTVDGKNSKWEEIKVKFLVFQANLGD